MSWEARSSSRIAYYYRTVSINGVKCREYHGNGPEAKAIAFKDKLERIHRQNNQLLWIKTKSTLIELAKSLRMFSRNVDYFLKTLAVFHKKKRDVWRARRGVIMLSREHLSLFESIKNDPTILKKVLRSCPEIKELYDLQSEIINRWLEKLSPDKLIEQPCYKERLEQIKDSLSQGSHCPLEDILTNRIVLAYLQVMVLEKALLDSLNNPPRASFIDKQLGQANMRLLSSVKALAQIRKIVPKIQVNIAKKQIISG